MTDPQYCKAFGLDYEKYKLRHNNPFKPGDKVRYRDGDPRTFIVYDLYSDTKLSLGLADYPDVEQDEIISIDEIETVV